MEEELDLFSDLLVRILKQHANVNDLTPDLEHVVEDQMSDDRQGLSAHLTLTIVEQLEELLRLLIQQVGEPAIQVRQGNHGVRLEPSFNL